MMINLGQCKCKPPGPSVPPPATPALHRTSGRRRGMARDRPTAREWPGGIQHGNVDIGELTMEKDTVDLSSTGG